MSVAQCANAVESGQIARRMLAALLLIDWGPAVKLAYIDAGSTPATGIFTLSRPASGRAMSEHQPQEVLMHLQKRIHLYL